MRLKMYLSVLTLLSILIGAGCDLISVLGSTPSPPTGQDVTSKVFKNGQNNNILPAVYGDFNGDKLTDIVTVDNNRTTVTVYLASKEAPYMRPGPSWNFTAKEDKEKFGKINSATIGDFDGDGLMDLMVTTSKIVNITDNLQCNITMNKTHHTMNITYTYTVRATELIFCTGNRKSINCTHPKSKYHLVQEPMAVDLNRDLILDIVGEVYEIALESKTLNYTTENGNCTSKHTPKLIKVKRVWFSEEGRPAFVQEESVFEGKRSTSLSNLPMAHPSSNAYVDVNSDLIPEIVLITVNESKQIPHHKETYDVIYDSGTAKLNLRLRHDPSPLVESNDVEVLGQPLFVDFERNAKLVHLIPYCANKKCSTEWGLLISNADEVFQKIELGIHGWKFVPPINVSEIINTTIVIKHAAIDGNEYVTEKSESNVLEDGHFYSRSLVLQAGDYNLDGYPDLLAVLEAKDTKRKAVVFENVPCTADSCAFSRTFQPNFKFLEEYENVTFASFFDLKENGILDVLIVQETINNGHSKNTPNYTVRAFETSSNVDSYFIKAMILSGRPCPQCLEKDVSYGNLIPGALVRYTMKDVDGRTQTAIASQVYRSGYTTLDTPYTIFGIGHSPNFVNHLHFFLGYRFSSENSRVFSQDSHQIIPNSQIIGIPDYPVQESKESLGWRVKLFLTPGDAVLQTFGVLIGIVAVVGVLASGLEYKERRIDRKERMAEARRFLM